MTTMTECGTYEGVPVGVPATHGLSRNHGQLLTWDAVREYVFAGNARFTLRSLKTGSRFTYRVRVKKADVERGRQGGDLIYFVSLLRGPDNEADYAYLGVLRQPGAFHLTEASRLGRQAPAYLALVWFLDKLVHGNDVLGRTLEVWHEGRCGKCGRALTVPESVHRGIGPECAGRMI